jgi:hypothetical protein
VISARKCKPDARTPFRQRSAGGSGLIFGLAIGITDDDDTLTTS